MTTHERIAPSKTPFERLADHFSRIPEDERHNDNLKRVTLGNGTYFEIMRSRGGGPMEPLYEISFYTDPKEQEKFPHEEIRFGISMKGLVELRLHKVEIMIGDSPGNLERGSYTFIPHDNKAKGDIAEKLADWFDHVTRENKYTPPPISVLVSL